MTRRVGQVTLVQALAGAVAVVLAVAAIVAGAHALVPGGTLSAPLDAPAGEGDPCQLPPRDSGPIEVRASALVECPDDYDARPVIYTGEAVRAVLQRSGRSWLHLNDDSYALDLGPLPEHRTAVGGNSGIPVSIPSSAVGLVDEVGDHEAHGTILRVTGDFRRADPDDGGGPSIHAETVEVVRPGRPLRHGMSGLRVAVAALLGTLALAVTTARRRSQRE